MAVCVVCEGSGRLLREVCPLCDGVPGWPEVVAEEPGEPHPTADSRGRKAHSRGRASEEKLWGNSGLLPVIWDMETGDPDDVLTLLLLGAAVERVELRAVTITPGSREQVSLVRWLLEEMGLPHVRVGAQEWPANAEKMGCMQGRFYDSFGRCEVFDDAVERADSVMLECCGEEVTLITGGPLHNLGAALQLPAFHIGRWVAQGGFAGEGVVPRELQMDKFKGKAQVSTWNFNGSIPSALAALSAPAIDRRLLVSKNVCHRAAYDRGVHALLGAAVGSAIGRRRQCLQLMHQAMDSYLEKKGEKKLHDPLAMAAALDSAVCQWAEVSVFKDPRRSEWGSSLARGTATWISVDYDEQKFHEVLFGNPQSVTED